jgi:hypothetical protein
VISPREPNAKVKILWKIIEDYEKDAKERGEMKCMQQGGMKRKLTMCLSNYPVRLRVPVIYPGLFRKSKIWRSLYCARKVFELDRSGSG